MNNVLDRHHKYLRYLLVLSFITFVILVAATSAQGACLSIDAVTTGTTASDTSTSMTVSHTTGSDSDRLMLVAISVNVNDDERLATIDPVTYGGTALTKVGEQANDNDAMVYIYSLVAPNPGTADVVITFDSALNYGALAGVMTFTGVHQSTPLGTFASAIGNDSTPASVNISSAPGELVFAVVTDEYDAITTAPTGQDVHWNTCTSGTSNCGAGGTIAGASTVTMTWDLDVEATPSNHWAIGGVSIKPAGTKNLVMVVGDAVTLSTSDQNKKTEFESWGWTVTAIDDGAAQGTYDTAAANNDVMYISESSASSTVGTKATLLDIGIVNEENYTWDQMRFTSSADQDLTHTTINISDNSHYITSPFSTGNMMIYPSADCIGNMTAGLASGGQSLATENNTGSAALFVFETDAALTSETAPNRRVGIPTSCSSFSSWNADVKTIVQRSLDWASGCGVEGGGGSGCGTNLVMVTGTDSSASPYDSDRQTLFESWGWTVTSISDTDSQSTYDNAATNNHVMYFSESCSAGNMGSLNLNLNIGMVVDEYLLWNNLGLSNSEGTSGSHTSMNVYDDSHYITSLFTAGNNIVIYSPSADSRGYLSSSSNLASGGLRLGQTSSSQPMLFTFDTGATLTSGTAANRRVGFPGAESVPSNWHDNWKTLMQRSLDWAAGCGAGGGSTNSDPVLNPIGNKSVDEGNLLEFTISATDGDGDTLTYSATSLPTGATFTPATQTFSWTPNVGDAGTYPDVTFTVDDDGTPQGSDNEGITITVNSSGGGGLGIPITAGDVAGYSCNMQITIDNTKVAFTSEHFPVLIDITDDSLKTSGCGFVTDPDGDDIVFTNATTTLQLYHEIEKYDAATGEIVAWVLVPSLSGTADTDIYMYFGDSNVTSPTESPTDVWDSNYVGVWHLDDTSGDTQDSTSENTDGVVSGTVTRGATGKIEDAFNFGTNGEVDWGDPADGHLDFGTGEMTLSLWVNMDNHRGVWEQVILKGKSSWESGYQIEVNSSSNIFYFAISDGSISEWGRSASISFSLDTWTHVVGVVDRSSNLLRAYKNGVQVDTTSISGMGSINVADELTIGRDTWGWPDARIEEVRISKTARSAEWIQTSYNNQNSPSSFYSVEKNCPTTIPPIAEFSCSIPLTIDSSKVSGTSDLIDFPVLISLTNTSLKTTGSCGYVQNSNGYDIIFSDAAQTTRLDHEIEKYDSAAGELVAWVRIPTLSVENDTTIYVHFGHGSVCGATENPTGVWDSNYTAVWHLKETSGGADAIKDSTARANHGTDFNSPTFGVTGKIGNAVDFDGTADYVTMPTSGFNTSAGTVELWTNIDTFPSADNKYMFSHLTSPTANRVYVNLKPDNTWGTGMGDTYDLVRGSVVSAGTWYHLVLTWDGTNVRGYKDGALNFGPTSYSGLTTVGNIYVSAWDGTAEWFDGTLDEVRVSETVRSADWIQTEYNNQSNPSSFYSVGTSGCFLGGFSCNRRITIDSTKVEGSSDLTNFPFLIEIQNDCNIKLAANGGGVQNDFGYDIIFMDSDGITQLDHEVEEYDGTNGDLTAWVRIPTLPYNTDKDIYMYYGNSDLTCDPSNPTGVWDSSYEAVYHLNGDVNDSTSNNRDGYNNNTGSYTAVIEEGRSFSPVDDFDIGTWGVSGQGLTMQAWARFDDFDQNDPRVFSKASSTSEQNHVFMLGLGGTGEQYLRMRLKTGTDDLSGTTTIVDTDDPMGTGTWYLIAGTYDGSNMRLLSNGVQVHSAAKTGNLRVNSWDIAIGNTPGGSSSSGYSLDGKLDEVRILSVARSADWLRTEYNNQSDPASFYSMSQDTCGGEYGFNFQYCKKITVDHTQVSSSLTRYPLLINITGDDDLKTVANGGRVQNSQGWDIVFKTSGCVNYDHEIEKYDGANGDLVAWVQIPTLSSSTDTEIYMYYGATVICSTENPTAVWDARFRAVYHLNDDFMDSTQYNRDGTNYGATFTAGKIGNGALFDPSDGYDRIELGTWDMSSDDFTVQAWAWPNDFNQDDPRIVSKGSTTGSSTQDHVWQFGLENGDNGENRMRFRLKTGWDDALGTVQLTGSSPNGYLPTAQTWYHLAGTYEDDNSAGTEMRLYVNGLAAGQLGHAGNIRQNSWPVWIGANPHGASSGAKSWDGVLDEVRILSSDLSQDWLETEYRNHNDPGNFYSITSCFEQTTEVTQEWVEEVQ